MISFAPEPSRARSVRAASEPQQAHAGGTSTPAGSMPTSAPLRRARAPTLALRTPRLCELRRGTLFPPSGRLVSIPARRERDLFEAAADDVGARRAVGWFFLQAVEQERIERAGDRGAAVRGSLGRRFDEME